MFFDPQNETRPRERLAELQLSRLQSLLARLAERSSFYGPLFKKMDLAPQDLRSLADLSYWPFTEKNDLRARYPMGLALAPPHEIVRYHASSGVSGQVTIIGYTKNDLAIWAQLMARSLVAAGLGSADAINVAFGYGLFTGGLGYHYGAELLGAAILPCSSGASHRQIALMRDLRVTTLCSTPTFALYLAELAQEMGLDFRDKKVFALKTGIFGAEPWSWDLGQKIEANLGIKAMDIYGLSEIMGPGVSAECEARAGLHVFEDHFIFEIIDPVTLASLPPGQPGELVLTTLTKEGVPLLRYRTRDIASLIEEPCPCGRTHRRMSRVTGRSDDMIIIRGVNLYPAQVETLILAVAGLSPHYQIIVDRLENLDTLEIVVELSPERTAAEPKELAALLARRVKIHLGVNVKVSLSEAMTLPRGQAKTQRVVDRRAGKM